MWIWKNCLRKNNKLAVNQLAQLFHETLYFTNRICSHNKHLQRQIHWCPALCKNYKESVENNNNASDEDNLDIEQQRDSKILNLNVNSLRLDLILKLGLNLGRNKIEKNFYEDKIRKNGKKVAKKSALINEGDEIDVIKGLSDLNPSLLLISRLIILAIRDNVESDGTCVTVRRYKSLLIENYSGQNNFKS